MVGTVNAVNITDGIDGLATGVTMPVMLFFTAVACFWGQLELGIFSAGLFGGLCGFLIYNFHPAKVFMGDTGSLFLGGAVCGLAFALDIPLVLILVGIIYILETLSDILQVGYFKLTHGKRIFRMAPLHHHLELSGWSEAKLVAVFSLVTLAGCVLAYLGVRDDSEHSAPARCGARQDPQTPRGGKQYGTAEKSPGGPPATHESGRGPGPAGAPAAPAGAGAGEPGIGQGAH